MKNFDTKRRLKSLFLLATYLVILALGSLHVHECKEDVAECQDCLEHVKHHNHVSQSSFIDCNCLLCQLSHACYITPEVLTFSAAALLPISFTVCATPKIVYGQSTLPSLRAPPAIC
ncbi:MAG: hypothetical protein MJZ41_10260 [Bacteroidaceae bacterium]|nr:hypothetical protein [Bacteroidaceae bacterium]